MDKDSLFIIFDFLDVDSKFKFGSTCSLWREIFQRWFDPFVSTLCILNKECYLNWDDLSLLNKVSKNTYQISNYLMEFNKSIKARWLRNHKKLCNHPKSGTQSKSEKNSLCNLISELGLGIWICNRDSVVSKIKIVSLWGQELTLTVEGLNCRLYFDCFYYHHCLDNKKFILHSVNRRQELVKIIIDFSNLCDIKASVIDSSSCCLLSGRGFHREHYFCCNDASIVCDYSRQGITSSILTPKGYKQILSQQPYDQLTFCGPYIVLFFRNNTIKLYDLTDDLQEFISTDRFNFPDTDILHLKYYLKDNIIYVFGKQNIQSARLCIDTRNKTFKITILGNLNLYENFYEHNSITKELERLTMKNSSSQFYYGSNRDNGCFIAFE